MTTLADLTVGQAFIAVGVLTAQDGVIGDTITLYGPAAVVQGTLVISPAGVFTGQLAGAASATPVQPAPALNPVAAGQVMQNSATGETYVAMRAEIMPDGTYRWSASPAGAVWYPMTGWTVVGTATIV